MKDLRYNYFQNFVIRVPHYPVEYLKDRSKVFTNLYKEALYLASPDLYEAMSVFDTTNFDELPFKIQLSLHKYLLRMSTRCTPFGLFAGCGVGSISDKNQIVIPGFNSYKSNTRFDMNFLCALAQKLNSLDELKPKIKYYLNTSVYKSDNEYRYVEYNYEKGQRKHFLTSIDNNPYIEKAFLTIINGMTITELAVELEDDENSIDDAKDFINLLIDNQLLISELEPSVIGKDVLDQMINFLDKMQDNEGIYQQLFNLKYHLMNIDKQPNGRNINNYTDIEGEIKNFNIDYEKKYLFQTDINIDLPFATIDKAIGDAAVDGLGILNRLAPYSENQTMKKFKEDFYNRYENEEIPLVEALDTDLGIGFDNLSQGAGDVNPLIDDLNIYAKAESSKRELNPVEAFLFNKYISSKSTQSHEIILFEEEIIHFPDNWDNLPPTLSSMIEVVEYNQDSGSFIIKMGAAGNSSAANLLGRFCYMNSEIEDMVLRIIKTEENAVGEDKIIAEIIHLPEARTGNVLYRPKLRSYEIPFLARHSVESEYIIPITDLMISCVNGKELTLRSKRLNKQIIPRLTSAHNFMTNALPIYHFLSLFQFNDLRPSMYFHWGQLSEKEYLPRVRYKNIIISPAIWNITKEETQNMPDLASENFLSFAINFKRERNIPDTVLLVQSDNKLFIDFEDPLSIKLLFSEMRNKAVQLEENLFRFGNSFINGPEGNYTNQIVLNFYKPDNNERK